MNCKVSNTFVIIPPTNLEELLSSDFMDIIVQFMHENSRIMSDTGYDFVRHFISIRYVSRSLNLFYKKVLIRCIKDSYCLDYIERSSIRYLNNIIDRRARYKLLEDIRKSHIVKN